MEDRLNNYLNDVFARCDGLRTTGELKEELYKDLQERLSDLKNQGYDEETAYNMTLDSIGDIEQTIIDIASQSRDLQQKVITNFSASNLPNSDLAGVAVHDGKFESSALRGTDFSNSDLTGSSFKCSDLREARFNDSNLTKAKLTMAALSGASFVNTNLEQADLNCSDLRDARFIKARLVETKLTKADLRNTTFENCIFNGVNFKYSDLRGICFDNQTFHNAIFDMSALEGTSFKNAVFRNVSFRYTFNKNKPKANFDGATMDKLTYALLKGGGVDLSKVTVL